MELRKVAELVTLAVGELPSINDEYPWMEQVEISNHNQIMRFLFQLVTGARENFANNIGLMSIEDREFFRSVVVDVLASMEYAPDFIESVDTMVEKFLLNPANSLQILIPYAEMAASSEEVSIRRGVFYDKYIANEEDERFIQTRILRRAVGLPCVVGQRDGKLISVGNDGKCIVRFIKNNVPVREVVDYDRVFIEHNDDYTTVAEVADYVYEEEDESLDHRETAIHQKYGKVEILSRTKDEYGNEMLTIIPTDVLSFISNNRLFYDISDSEIGVINRIESIKPIVCSPSELFGFGEIKSEYRDIIKRIDNDLVKPAVYSAFSSGTFTSGAFFRDRQTKSVKNFEKAEVTQPHAFGLDEEVYVIANLPREEIRGDRSNLYHLQLRKLGKVCSDKAKIEVTPVTKPITVDGVTSYKAKIVDTFDTLKIKKVVNGTSVWETQKKSPMVLVMGAESGRIFTTPAWWLYRTDIPESIEMTCHKYKLTGALPRKTKNVSDLDKFFSLVDTRKVKIDFSKANHRRFFDIFAGRKELCYQYTDPTTNETVETPEVFVYNPLYTDDPELDSLITASKVLDRRAKEMDDMSYIESIHDSSEEDIEEGESLEVVLDPITVSNDLKVKDATFVTAKNAPFVFVTH